VVAGGANSSCPAGSYCPLGSVSPTPCPAGTYNPYNGSTSLSNCLSCPAGKYCSSPGLTAVSGTCSAGYVCMVNATSATPTDGVTGRICPLGNYCPAGTTTALVCSPGNYCGATGLGAVSGPCNAGYLCQNNGGVGAVDPFGRTSFGGAIYPCPAGSYCLQGNATATPCIPGTFNNVTGGMDISICLPCTPGSYCATPGLTAPTGLCAAGSFCAGGDTIANP
jgi:hypothetical protein